MALPTAQLGAMANLNTPSYVPLQVIPRQPTIWQQALASFLGNVADTAGQKLATNELEAEHAGEFGQAPSSGWDRLMHGSAVNDKEAAQIRDINSATSLLGTREAGENTRLGLSETGANTRNAADILARATEGQANRALTASEGSAARSATMDQLLKEQMFKGQEQTNLFGHEDKLLGPKYAADATEAGARSGLYNAQADTARRTAALIPEAPTKVISKVNPNIATFAKDQGNVDAAMGPAPTTDADMIRSMLSQGMSPDAAMGAMQTLQAKQQGVQNVATQRGQQADEAVATKAAIIQSIMQRLHPTMPGQASVYDMQPY